MRCRKNSIIQRPVQVRLWDAGGEFHVS